MTGPTGRIWLVAREYAGLAEAGGVKNVTCSMAEGLARSGSEVTAFLPLYGFMDVRPSPVLSVGIDVGDTAYPVEYSSLEHNGVRIILVAAPVFSDKRQVYVYTEAEASAIPGASRGSGHLDVDVMNVLFQKAVARFAVETGERPGIVHCHDAHAALLPALARHDPLYSAAFRDAAFFVTIHNAGPGYRQPLGKPAYAARLTGLDAAILDAATLEGEVEPFLLSAPCATLTTVSPWYAGELTDPLYDARTGGFSGELRRRGIFVTGITNGMDRPRYCPRFTERSLLPFAFDPPSGDLAGKYLCRGALVARFSGDAEPGDIYPVGSARDAEDAVWFCYQGRIVPQKGLAVFADAARILLESEPRARFVTMGQGVPSLEDALYALAEAFPGRFLFLRGYERALARLVVASSDFLVLPSEYEPCGLEDYIGQIYGTLPIARAVGGLNKIRDGETGFLYGGDPIPNDPADLAAALTGILRDFARGGGRRFVGGRFLRMIRNAARSVEVEADWGRIIREEYLPLYEKNIPPSY